VARKLNIRGGFNAFSYSRRFDKDGITYNGDLNLRSGSALLDWFPFGGGFHLSPGALVYNNIGAKANALVPAGQAFTLGGTTYQSDTANPVTGKRNLGFTMAAPMVLFGWGNLVPRHKHFIFKFETGVVFQGSAPADSPKALVRLLKKCSRPTLMQEERELRCVCFNIPIGPGLKDLLEANVNDVAELRSSRGHLAQIKEVGIEGIVSSWRRVNGAAAFEHAGSILRVVQAGH
jgi:hypothetical protein